jgi:DNA-directed RNA polymerase specialized sigma24 family protein
MRDHSNPSMTQTNWDLIRDAASGSSTAKASLDAVMKRAWPAVYAFIRASGRRSEEATELTQAFICDVFLARRLLEKADQSRGRFRTLLIGAVRNYLADTHRRATAAIRAPKSSLIAIDAMSESGFDMTSDGARSAPERAFNARFVAGLIRAASERLQRELESEGDHASWEIFRLRVLQAAFQGSAPGYEEIAPRLGIERGACAAKLLVAKRRFATILMDELRATILDPNDLHHEVSELLSFLEGR